MRTHNKYIVEILTFTFVIYVTTSSGQEKMSSTKHEQFVSSIRSIETNLATLTSIENQVRKYSSSEDEALLALIQQASENVDEIDKNLGAITTVLDSMRPIVGQAVAALHEKANQRESDAKKEDDDIVKQKGLELARKYRSSAESMAEFAKSIESERESVASQRKFLKGMRPILRGNREVVEATTGGQPDERKELLGSVEQLVKSIRARVETISELKAMAEKVKATEKFKLSTSEKLPSGSTSDSSSKTSEQLKGKELSSSFYDQADNASSYKMPEDESYSYRGYKLSSNNFIQRASNATHPSSVDQASGKAVASIAQEKVDSRAAALTSTPSFRGGYASNSYGYQNYVGVGYAGSGGFKSTYKNPFQKPPYTTNPSSSGRSSVNETIPMSSNKVNSSVAASPNVGGYRYGGSGYSGYENEGYGSSKEFRSGFNKVFQGASNPSSIGQASGKALDPVASEKTNRPFAAPVSPPLVGGGYRYGGSGHGGNGSGEFQKLQIKANRVYGTPAYPQVSGASSTKELGNPRP